jgi:hypothetical protein
VASADDGVHARLQFGDGLGDEFEVGGGMGLSIQPG